jgi:hypothetical protein
MSRETCTLGWEVTLVHVAQRVKSGDIRYSDADDAICGPVFSEPLLLLPPAEVVGKESGGAEKVFEKSALDTSTVDSPDDVVVAGAVVTLLDAELEEPEVVAIVEDNEPGWCVGAQRGLPASAKWEISQLDC